MLHRDAGRNIDQRLVAIERERPKYCAWILTMHALEGANFTPQSRGI